MDAELARGGQLGELHEVGGGDARPEDRASFSIARRAGLESLDGWRTSQVTTWVSRRITGGPRAALRLAGPDLA